MRHHSLTALLLVLPLAFAPAACGGGDEDAGPDREAMDRELDMALGSDTARAAFQDTALADAAAAEEGTAEATPAADATPAPTRPATERPRRQAERPAERRPEAEPEPEPAEEVPQPRTVTRQVPIGTSIVVRMNEELSTERTRVGDAFTARLESPVVDADGTVLIPAGATVRGRVTGVAASGRVGQTAVMTLAFEAISFDGESYPLEATVQRADVQQKTRTSAAESAGKVAAGAAAGAILGQVLGKDRKSTLKGAAIGAAAGTAIAMGTADVDAVLPEDGEVVIRLDRPIEITRTVVR